MGTNFLPPDTNNPSGYFEDQDFLWINKGLIEAAGGTWYAPPERETIYSARGKFMKNLVKTVQRKQKAAGSGIWGWKDPRTCLTIDLYYPWLDYPRILRVKRNRTDIINSLQKINTNGNYNPESLCQIYEERITLFIHRVGADHIDLYYDRLVSRSLAGGEITKLAKFLGIPLRRFHDIYNVISFRK